MERLRALWHFLIFIFRRAPEERVAFVDGDAASRITESSPPGNARVNVRAGQGEQGRTIPELEPAPEPPPEPKLSRHDRRRHDALRRKYERLRMKHDVWVNPGGPEPVKRERLASTEDKPPPPPPLVVDEFKDPNDKLIIDEWIEGDGGAKVLFDESEFYGTFNFRDTILAQLERYWVYLERMKKGDAGAYQFYKRIGATLVPYLATGTRNKHEYFKKIEGEELRLYKESIKLTPWFKQHWPSFGCMCYGVNPQDEERERTECDGNLWTPKFMYFRRYEHLDWYVQPMPPGKYYVMTMWWDRPDHPKTKNKWGVPNDFPLWISNDGTQIRALKTRESSNGTIRPAHDWRIPHGYREWAKLYGLTAQLHLTYVFCMGAKDIEATYYATCRVEVTKGDLCAVFGIEPRRLPYFFRDRDITLDKHGHKQRIFHVVRPYVRADGVAVPMQFRGLHEFDWAGYHVKITVPGRDHFPLQEFDVPSRMLKPRARMTKDLMTEGQVAIWLRERMNRGLH